MTKQDILKELNESKSEHMKLHAFAQAISLGMESAEKVPQLYTDCNFGKWYYSIGQLLNFITEYEEIEQIHERVHELYIEIYQKYNEILKTGLFTSEQKAEARRQKELKVMTLQLKEAVNLFVDKISEIETIINNMSNEELANKIA